METKQVKRPGIDIDFFNLDREQLQSLSGKKKFLFEIQTILQEDELVDNELPALAKIRGTRGAMKSVPAISIPDLKVLLKALMETTDRDVEDLKILERLD